jgi:hypothetical protein
LHGTNIIAGGYALDELDDSLHQNLAHTFSLFLTTICNKSATLNSSDPSFSQPISIYLLHLYKSPDAPSPKFIEKLTRTTGSDSSTREKENEKHGNFSKWVAWKKIQLNKSLGFQKMSTTTTVFFKSSSCPASTGNQSWKNSPVIIQQQQQQQQ